MRHINLGNPPSFFYTPTWSPDSKKIAYSDKRLQLWYVDLDNPAPKPMDTDYFGGFGPTQLSQTWSPDSKWVAYTKQLPSGQHAVFVYSLEQGKASQITDGMSDVLYPAWDKNGKYLYFTASTDVALTTAGLDMSSDEHRVSRSAYVAVLSKDEKSPLAPESDEEKPKEEKKPDQEKEKDKNQSKETGKDRTKDKKADDKSASDKDKDDKDKNKEKDDKEKDKPVVVKIELEGIGQRILSLPIAAKNYLNMVPGKSGILFFAEGPQVLTDDDQPNVNQTIQKFDLSKRKVDKFMDEVNDFTVSFDGEKILYRKGESWATASADDAPGGGGPPKPGFGPLKLDGWEVYVEPRAMWKQIYNETWRIERDFFYDPHYHGLDLDKAKKKYAPYLEGIASRGELTYLFQECLGELTVGHMFIRGGDHPEPKKVKGGLLGADYSLENGRYRIAKVYDGENWNPGNQAPLTQPGVNVKAGDYLLAVNGRDLHASDNIYSFFEATAGKQVVLKVGPNPDAKESRDVTVVPVESEAMGSPSPGLDREQSPPRRSGHWRPRRLRPCSRYRGRGLHQLQPLLLLASGQRRCHHRRTLQRRWTTGRLHHRSSAPSANEQGRDPRRSRLVEPVRGNLRPQSDDHQRRSGLRWGRFALVLSQGRHRHIDWQKNVGRAGGNWRLSATHRRWQRHRATGCDLTV